MLAFLDVAIPETSGLTADEEAIAEDVVLDEKLLKCEPKDAGTLADEEGLETTMVEEALLGDALVEVGLAVESLETEAKEEQFPSADELLV